MLISDWPLHFVMNTNDTLGLPVHKSYASIVYNIGTLKSGDIDYLCLWYQANHQEGFGGIVTH